MYSARNQAGITFIGIILSIVPIAFIVYLIIRAVPAYIESYSVGDVVSSLKKEIDLPSKPKEEIYRMIQKRLEINDIHSVTQDDITIQKTPTEVSIKIAYESRTPLFSNVALVFSFSKSAVVR